MGSADELVPDVMQKIFDASLNSLLDCACGYLSRVRLSISGKRAYLVGCDLWLPNIRFCKKHQVYDDVIRCDVRALPLRDRSFEVVIACEVAEHLSKCDSQEFIVRAQRIPTKRFPITTPNGSWYQDESSGFRLY
jgi:2-polyprenyl-3-methyl-5-hydroxy-6-metoxy-1,4-benzoquinol methylase